MNTMKNKLLEFSTRHELLLQGFIFLLFLAVSIPGVNWGTPNLWNPDEMVWRVDNALGGELIKPVGVERAFEHDDRLRDARGA